MEKSPIVERSVRAVRVRSVELTDGVDFGSAPRLLGFVKTKARKDAEESDKEELAAAEKEKADKAKKDAAAEKFIAWATSKD